MGETIRKFLFGQAKLTFWCLLGGLFLLNLLYKGSLVASFAPDLGGFERNVILGIQQILLGKGLYSNPEASPFFIIQYMPLYYYLVAGLAFLFRIDPLDAHSVYFLARAFNLVLLSGSSFLLYRMATLHFLVRKSIVGPVALVAFFWMEKFTISGRPDTLKVFLFQLLVFALLHFPERRKRWIFPLAVLIGSLCFASKQDGLVFLGILPLSLLFQSKWKEMALWGVISAIGVGLMVGLFHAILGSFFLTNVAGGLQNGLSISWFVSAFGNYFGFMALLFGLGFVLSLEFACEQNHKLRVVSAAFFCSFFPQLFFSLKFGSGPNYFLECTFLSLLILSIWLQTNPLKDRFVYPQAPVFLAVVAVGLLFFIPAINWTTSVFLNQESRLQAEYESQKKIAQFIRSSNPGKTQKVLVLIGRQWEDHLTSLLPDLCVAPQRDVIAQIATGKGRLTMHQ